MKYKSTAILILLAAGQTSYANEVTDTRNYSELIIGTWSEIEKDECGSNQAVYKPNGLKLVQLTYCDDKGVPINHWYKSRWSINGNTITEITFEYSPTLAKESNVTLPHTEVDTIHKLSKNKLVIGARRRKNFYQRVVESAPNNEVATVSPKINPDTTNTPKLIKSAATKTATNNNKPVGGDAANVAPQSNPSPGSNPNTLKTDKTNITPDTSTKNSRSNKTTSKDNSSSSVNVASIPQLYPDIEINKANPVTDTNAKSTAITKSNIGTEKFNANKPADLISQLILDNQKHNRAIPIKGMVTRNIELDKAKSKPPATTKFQVSYQEKTIMNIIFPKKGERDYKFSLNIDDRVQLADRNHDGHIDYLKYHVKDNNGYSITVFDYEMDGQADQKVYLPADPNSKEAGFIKVWYKGRWYRIMEKNNKLGIVVDDTFIAGKVHDNGRISADGS